MASLHQSPSYIVRNPYSYCFRMNVPKDLQFYIGKKELRYSLRTGYLGVAKSKARLLAGLFQNLFNSLRAEGTVMKLKLPEIREIVNSTIRGFLEYTEAHRVVGVKELDFTTKQGELSDRSDTMGIGLPSTKSVFALDELANSSENLSQNALVDADYTKYERTVQTMIKLAELDIEKDSPEYMILSREFLKAYNQYAKIEQKRNNGDYSDDAEAMFPLANDTVAANGSKVVSDTEHSILLEDLYKAFKAQKLKSKVWDDGTVRNHRPKINSFRQFVGNIPVKRITKPIVIEYARLLDHLPRRYTDHAAYKDLSKVNLDALIGKHDETLDVTTKRSYLLHIQALFEFALNFDYVDKNPVKGLVPPKKKGEREQQNVFSMDDLAIIFKSEHYPLEGDKPSRFWLPIIGLYTGCRLEEICQLYIEDVYETDGLWVLDLNKEKDKKLKNEASKRLVPLHPFLVETLRFPEFVKKVKNKGYDRVFYELTKYNNKYGHKLTDWFSSYKKKAGIVAPRGKKVFHSFRHTVNDYLYKELVEESLIEEFLGRTGKTETSRRYGKGHKIENFYKKCVLILDYQIDLSHLKKSKFVMK